MTPQPGPTNTLTDVARPAGRARDPHRAGLAHRHHRGADPGGGSRRRCGGARRRPGHPGDRPPRPPQPRRPGPRRGADRRQRARPRRRGRGVPVPVAAGRRLAHGRARRGGPDRARRCAVRPRAWRRVRQPPGCGRGTCGVRGGSCRRRWHSGASAPAPAPRPAVSRGASAAPARSSRTAPRSASWSRSTRSGPPTTRPRASCWPCATASARSSPASDDRARTT